MSIGNYKLQIGKFSITEDFYSSSATVWEPQIINVTNRLSSTFAGYYSVQLFPFTFCKSINSQILLWKYCVYLDLCDELGCYIKGVFGYLELRRSFVSKRDNKRL